MKPERIAELRRLCDAATEGPWRDTHGSCCAVVSDAYGSCCAVVSDAYETPDMRRWIVGAVHGNDAPFIAAARTAVPELLDEIERLRTRLADVKRQLRGQAKAAQRLSRDARK